MAHQSVTAHTYTHKDTKKFMQILSVVKEIAKLPKFIVYLLSTLLFNCSKMPVFVQEVLLSKLKLTIMHHNRMHTIGTAKISQFWLTNTPPVTSV